MNSVREGQYISVNMVFTKITFLQNDLYLMIWEYLLDKILWNVENKHSFNICKIQTDGKSGL